MFYLCVNVVHCVPVLTCYIFSSNFHIDCVI